MSHRVRIGARGSPLSRYQATAVAGALRSAFAGAEVDLVWISTEGDRDRSSALASFGGTGVFTKEIEAALLAGEVDVAVHSLKDLPTRVAQGLTIAAVLERADPRDAFVSVEGASLDSLPQHPRIGTGSLRRSAQVLALRPDAEIAPIRGNVQTRVSKVAELGLSGVILAAAGLLRLELGGHIAELLDPERFPHAPGQGAIAAECRADDEPTMAMLRAVDHAATHGAIGAERAALRTIEAGCQAPFGVHCTYSHGGGIRLMGCVTAHDGSRQIRHAADGDDPLDVGRSVAEELLTMGARELLGPRSEG